jgi:hypothetical protein
MFTQAAASDGQSSVLEIAASKPLEPKDQPFSLTALIHSPNTGVDVAGRDSAAGKLQRMESGS